MQLPNARTHWGKQFSKIPGIAEHLRRVLDEDLQNFLKIRDNLGVDPDKLFVNPFLEHLFFKTVNISC